MAVLSPHPRVRTAQAFFFFNTGVWLLLGVLTLTRMDQIDLSPTFSILYAALMFGNALAMLISGIGLGTHRKLFYYFALILAMVNVITSLTDQFGWPDLLILLLSAATLVVVSLARRHFKIGRVRKPVEEPPASPE